MRHTVDMVLRDGTEILICRTNRIVFKNKYINYDVKHGSSFWCYNDEEVITNYFKDFYEGKLKDVTVIGKIEPDLNFVLMPKGAECIRELGSDSWDGGTYESNSMRIEYDLRLDGCYGATFICFELDEEETEEFIAQWLGIRKKEKPRKNIITLPFNELNEANTAKEVAELMLETKRKFSRLIWPVTNEDLDVIVETTSNNLFAGLRYFMDDAKKKYHLLYEEENDGATRKGKFSRNVDEIKWIDFSKGGYHRGYDLFEIILCKDVVKVKKYVTPLLDENLCKTSLKDRNIFLEGLKRLNIEKWKADYYKPVLDGTQWSLTFYFEDEIVSYSGSNAFPSNFNQFLKLIK